MTQEPVDPDKDLPEELQLHVALSLACFALDLIANHAGGGFESHVARTTLDNLRRRYPAAREHLPPEPKE